MINFQAEIKKRTRNFAELMRGFDLKINRLMKRKVNSHAAASLIDVGHYRVEHAQAACGNLVMINWPLTSATTLKDVELAYGNLKSHYDKLYKELYFDFYIESSRQCKSLPKILEFLSGNGVQVSITANDCDDFDFWTSISNRISKACLLTKVDSDEQVILATASHLSSKIQFHIDLLVSSTNFAKAIRLTESLVRYPDLSLALQIDGENPNELSLDQREILANQYELFTKKIIRTRPFVTLRGPMRVVHSNGHFDILSPFDIKSGRKNYWQGWECSAGLESLIIDKSGNLYRGWCKVGGKLGRIGGRMELPKKPIVCTKSCCECNLGIMTTKEKFDWSY